MLERPLCFEMSSYKPIAVEFVYSLTGISYANEETRIVDNGRSIALNQLYIASKTQSRYIHIPKSARVRCQPNKTWSIPELHSIYISASNISSLLQSHYDKAVLTKNGCYFLLPWFANLLVYNPNFAFLESILD